MVHSGEEKPGSTPCSSGSLWDIAEHPRGCTNCPSPGKQNQGVDLEGPTQPLPAGSLKPARLSPRQRSRPGRAGRGRDPQPGWARAQTRLKLQDVRNPPGICQHAPCANSQCCREAGSFRGEAASPGPAPPGTLHMANRLLTLISSQLILPAPGPAGKPGSLRFGDFLSHSRLYKHLLKKNVATFTTWCKTTALGATTPAFGWPQSHRYSPGGQMSPCPPAGSCPKPTCSGPADFFARRGPLPV